MRIYAKMCLVSNALSDCLAFAQTLFLSAYEKLDAKFWLFVIRRADRKVVAGHHRLPGSSDGDTQVNGILTVVAASCRLPCKATKQS
jgi:hypothetical protein